MNKIEELQTRMAVPYVVSQKMIKEREKRTYEMTLRECTSKAGNASWESRTAKQKSAHIQMMVEARQKARLQRRKNAELDTKPEVQIPTPEWEAEYLVSLSK